MIHEREKCNDRIEAIAKRLEDLADEMKTWNIAYSAETRRTMTHAATAYHHAAEIVREELQ